MDDIFVSLKIKLIQDFLEQIFGKSEETLEFVWCLKKLSKEEEEGNKNTLNLGSFGQFLKFITFLYIYI